MTKEQDFAKIKDIIEDKRKAGEDILTGETGHFMVIFKGRSMYREYGSYLDTDPGSLATFLEDGMSRISVDYGYPVLNKGQAITVRDRGISLYELMVGGWNEGTNSSEYPEIKGRDIGSTTIMARRNSSSDSGKYPPIYLIAGHEALGHGYFQPCLNLELIDFEKRKASFVAVYHEGICQYIGQQVCGVDSHKAFANWLADAADRTWFDYPALSEEFDREFMNRMEPTQDKLRYYFSKISLPTTFLLNDPVELSRSEAGMHRGASFVKYVVDNFGRDALKQWVSQGNRENYVNLLENITEKPICETQKDWRNLVMENMQQTINLELEQKNISSKKLARRRIILDMFQKYS